jgi:hypothetical protein
MMWGVQHKHLMKQGKRHDEEEGAKEQVEESLLVFSKPAEFVKHIIKVFATTLFSESRARLEVLWPTHGSKLASLVDVRSDEK